MMVSDFDMHVPNIQKRQFQENWHLPMRDICAVNNKGLAYVLFSAYIPSKIDWPNKEFPLIFSNGL